MSYSQTFHTSVQVSGFVSVSYPASKTGGVTTANYSQTVPVDCTIEVNTLPFDNSVRQTEGAVDALTGSVVALNTAQIASIRDSSKKVVRSLTNGFFNMIGKDLSENMTLQANTVKSKFALLLQYSKDLLAKQERMDEDVARLRQHYFKIFNGLDEDLEKRIAALDQPAFRLANVERKDVLSGPYLKNAAFGVSQLREDEKTVNSLSVARTKNRVLGLLHTMGDFTRKCIAYKKDLNSVLDRNAAETDGQEYVPVVVSLGADLSGSEGITMQCISPKSPASQSIEAGVMRYMQTKSDPGLTPVPADAMGVIDQTFCRYVENDSSSQDPYSSRVHQVMMKMWEANKNQMSGI